MTAAETLLRVEGLQVRYGPALALANVSLALRLTFRAADRTLTDEEVAAQRQKISAALSDQLDGRVRDS